MNEDELRAFRTRFGIPISDADSRARRRSTARRRQHRNQVHARAAQGARRLSCRARKIAQRRRSTPRRADALRGVLQGHRRPQGVDDDGVRADAVEAAARQGHRQAGRADRARRSAHVRHGGAVPPGRHLLARRPALRAGRHGHAAVLQGSVATARFSRKASPRPARCRRSSPPAPPTRRTASTRSRSSSTTRCSASSASAI